MKNLTKIPIESTNQSKKHKIKKGIATHFANEEYEVKKKWYEEIPEYEDKECPKVSEQEWIALKDEAKKHNDADALAYNIKNSKVNSDFKWMKTAVTKGTVSDKIAANILLIQDKPVYNLQTIHNIVNMVKVGKKKECIAAIDSFTELLLSDLLRPNVKLKPFYEQPISRLDELVSGNIAMKKKYLSYWYFEDQLKECYTTFVQAVNSIAHDTVEANKEKAITAMYKLLVGNPEQEKNLLSHIVNKLGDPVQKVASKAIYCLGQIIYEHPNMKQVVLNEVERLLFRPNVSTRSQYYGICFLTQFILTIEDFQLAKNLIAVYFAFFKACVKKNEFDSRLMSALLTGVNRAFPYAKSELTNVSEHINTIYKVVHVANFNVGIHALTLIQQVSDYNSDLQDRFYSALYKKLLDPEIGSTKYQALFLNLVFKALKKDMKISRIKVFIKRLLQLALYMQPPMACGILFLIDQLIKGNKKLLAFKNIPSEDCKEPIIDLSQIVPDVKEEEENTIDPSKINLKKKETSNTSDTLEINAAVINEDNSSAIEDEKISILIEDIVNADAKHPKITSYNPLNRNPLYSGGQFCVYLELLLLLKHYHPTVVLYASKIIKGQPIVYSGDPLKDFTLAKFLERFSFKNPKNSSEIEKKGINPVFGKRKLKVAKGIKSHAVNSKSYLSHKSNAIPVEEQFIYTYLHKKQEEIRDDDDSDIESVASEDFEELLNKMTGKKHDDELDYMNDIGESLKEQKTKKKKNEDDESDDEKDESEEDYSGDDFDGDDDFEDNEIMEDDEFGDNEEFIFGSDLEDESPATTKKKKKPKFDSVFASVEEFSAVLDEEEDFLAGTSNAVINKDKADIKQIAWEQKRDRWIKGYNNAIGKKDKKINKIKPKTNLAKRTKSQGGNKHKKQKKR